MWFQSCELDTIKNVKFMSLNNSFIHKGFVKNDPITLVLTLKWHDDFEIQGFQSLKIENFGIMF
jgi:hypothetical protein